MGEIVAVSDDIEQMGRDFGTAASSICGVLAQLQQAASHVRHAFHNHPEKADAAVAPFTHVHGTIEQAEQLASALAVALIDVSRSYRAIESTVASGWQRGGGITTHGGRR